MDEDNSGVAKLVRRRTVNAVTRGFESLLLSQKKCCACKQLLQIKSFWKNKTKPDGYQNHCIQCSKGHWGKNFVCDDCGIAFYVSHRNVSKRKTKKCITCARKFATTKIIASNKRDATYVSYTQKGYRVITVPGMSKYQLEHRKVMADHIGRALTKTEVVHHIDEDKLNNKIENLWLTNHANHRKAHNSLLRAAWSCVKNGTIVFNKEKGIYEVMT